jgi:nucleotide-binding universal stress UspA family protein
MKILVPVDGSNYSMEGIKVASEFSRTRIAGIYLITIMPYISDMDLELSASDRDRLLEGMKRRGEDVLEKARNLLESYGAHYIRTVLSISTSAAHEIVTFAEKEVIDLIIIGSRGLGSGARFFLGSVATKVVKHSPCCVYVVRGPSWT